MLNLINYNKSKDFKVQFKIIIRSIIKTKITIVLNKYIELFIILYLFKNNIIGSFT